MSYNFNTTLPPKLYFKPFAPNGQFEKIFGICDDILDLSSQQSSSSTETTPTPTNFNNMSESNTTNITCMSESNTSTPTHSEEDNKDYTNSDILTAHVCDNMNNSLDVAALSLSKYYQQYIESKIKKDNVTNIIFLDFDDTLFPTTYLKSECLAIPIKTQIRRSILKLYDKLQQNPNNIIKILSNAHVDWVRPTISRLNINTNINNLEVDTEIINLTYTRQSLEKFCNVEIISTIDITEKYTPLLPELSQENILELYGNAKKMKIIQHIDNIKAENSNNPNMSYNIFSIGDSEIERYAILSYSIEHNIPVKSIKLKENPIPYELEMAHNIIKDNIDLLLNDKNKQIKMDLYVDYISGSLKKYD